MIYLLSSTDVLSICMLPMLPSTKQASKDANYVTDGKFIKTSGTYTHTQGVDNFHNPPIVYCMGYFINPSNSKMQFKIINDCTLLENYPP